ncbi:hypothetical protein AB1L12_19785 [Peribacillus frigoritolerans]|uniref:hypothetical protein n=1 Tax=Peribacillus frigoritolerans TaxID=450367 RepID=UPI0039A19A8F
MDGFYFTNNKETRGIQFKISIGVSSWNLHANEDKKLKVYAVSLESKNQTIKELQNIINGF